MNSIPSVVAAENVASGVSDGCAKLTPSHSIDTVDMREVSTAFPLSDNSVDAPTWPMTNHRRLRGTLLQCPCSSENENQIHAPTCTAAILARRHPGACEIANATMQAAPCTASETMESARTTFTRPGTWWVR